MTSRALNFNAGPAAMPLEVLQEAQQELLDFRGAGMSILEMSHRSAEYDAVHRDTQERVARLLGLGDEYKVMFFGGGATAQFAMVPMNLLHDGQTADYILTGSWSKKAVKEAKLFGKVNVAATTEQAGKFTRIPREDELQLTDGAAYVHLTSNNTIFGTQWHSFPTVQAPLVADMSSDILSRSFDASRFALIYAGAQKNLGPAGVTVVIMRKDMFERCKGGLPVMFHYPTQGEADSLSNTPPCYGVYLVGLTCKWIESQGGVAAIEAENRRKGDLLYAKIDEHSDFYRAPVERESRSYMNVVFRLPSEELERRFLAEAKQRGMAGIKGHRSVGGIRFSIYNAVPYDWVVQATDFMSSFLKDHA